MILFFCLIYANSQTKKNIIKNDNQLKKTKVVYIGCYNEDDTTQITNYYKYNTKQKVESKLNSSIKIDNVLYTNFLNYIVIVTKGLKTDIKVTNAGFGTSFPHSYIQPYTIHHYSLEPYSGKDVKLYIYDILSDSSTIKVDSCVFKVQTFNIQITIGGKKPKSTIKSVDLLNLDSTNLISTNLPTLKIVGFELNWQGNGIDGSLKSQSNYLTNEMRQFLKGKKRNNVAIEFIKVKFPDGTVRIFDSLYKVDFE